MSFDKLTPNQRIQAANIDCMRHPQFSRLAGVIAMGKSETSPAIPTACTNVKDKLYGAEFIGDMTRKQLRYLVLHENFHVALKHCVLPYYVDLFKKHGQLSNMAADYLVNGMIEELDPEFKFVERPTKVPPLVDAKYEGMSFPQVLHALIQDAKDNPEQQPGQGDPMDEHEMSPEELPVEAREKLEKMIDDAKRLKLEDLGTTKDPQYKTAESTLMMQLRMLGSNAGPVYQPGTANVPAALGKP